MAIIITSVGDNKLKVIKIYREQTGVGLQEAVDALNSIEAENLPLSLDVEDEETVLNLLLEAGAEAYSDLFTSEDFNTDDNEDTHFTPLFATNTISHLEREDTMAVLLEVEKIAKESEGYDLKISQLKDEISQHESEVKKIKTALSSKAKKHIGIITIVAAILGWALGAFLIAIIVALIAYKIAKSIIGKADLEKHKSENEAKAEAYMSETIAPLKLQLDDVIERRKNLSTSGKKTWAIDVIGKDLFYSACIRDLYNLIKARRADNLKEALNKYDDEQHKAAMEEMQAAIQNASELTAAESVKQTAYSKEIAKSTHQTATASKATAYHTRQIQKNTKQIQKNTRRFR